MELMFAMGYMGNSKSHWANNGPMKHAIRAYGCFLKQIKQTYLNFLPISCGARFALDMFWLLVLQ